MGKKNIAVHTVCENRKARHDYFIHETYEAGLELFGTEVKSLRAGKANLKDSYASIKNGEIFLENMHISPYDQGSFSNQEPLRKKRLLMHKSEIMKLFGQTREKGYTLIPLKVYFKRGYAKVELALAARQGSKARHRACAEGSPARVKSGDENVVTSIENTKGKSLCRIMFSI